MAPSVQCCKVWLTLTVKTRKPLKLPGVPQTAKPISAASEPKFTILLLFDDFCVLYLQRAACSTFQACILNSHYGHTTCGSMVDTQFVKKKRKRVERQGKNIMSISAIQSGHKNRDNTTHLPMATKTSDKQQFALLIFVRLGDSMFLSRYLFLFIFSVHRIFDVSRPIFAKLCHTLRYVLK